MEMEGRGYSDLIRNSSEEIVIKSLMENPIGISAPSMEMMGFKNISQSFRGDSEELFNSWLTNIEIPGFGSTSYRPRQTSRRISTDLAVSCSQQNGSGGQKRIDNDNLFLQNLGTPDEPTRDISQHSLRNAAEKGMEASNAYLAKAWFHCTQPMTRSRSSELRRKYAAMQNSHIEIAGAPHDMPGRDTNQMNCDIPMGEMPTQGHSFMPPSYSSMSPFSTPQMGKADTVSSVVSMLKGTLERKKLGNQIDKDNLEGIPFGFCKTQDDPANISSDQIVEPPRTFHMVSPVQVSGAELNFEGFVTPSNQIQMTTTSREPSQSGSSAAAPAVSTGFEVCDGPANSSQAFSVCESCRKHIGNGASDHGSNAKEFRDSIFENDLKNDEKKRSLVQIGSISSVGSGDRGDPTKKHRVDAHARWKKQKKEIRHQHYHRICSQF